MKGSLLGISLALMLGAMNLAGCKQQEEEKPSHLLTIDQMIDITTDIQLIEAALNYRRNIGLDFIEARESYYTELFVKYEINRPVYDQNVIYCNRKPERMEFIYNEVLARLENLQNTAGSKVE
jgi:hypothetical protein